MSDPRLTRSESRPRASEWSTLRTVTVALVISVGYYLGCQLGFVLTFPQAISSVLWPPNALLTSTLLLTAPGRWWIYLLAVLPAHLIVELQVGLPLPLVAALFATNCSEALIAAVIVRRFSDAPGRFDTLRRAVVFIGGAGVAAPFLSSFADAGVVSWMQSGAYWVVWRTRFFSNVLTELTLVPAVVMLVTAGPGWIRTASRSRRVEAGLLALSLAVAALVAFAGVSGGSGAIPGSPQSPLAFVLPFLLWAALRFGPGGVSLSLVTAVWIAIAAGMRGLGPFATLPAEEAVLALQISLSVLAIPLMCLAGVIEERRRANRDLEERLGFEAFLARLSGAFVHLPSEKVDPALGSWLAPLGDFFGLDRVTLQELPDAVPGLAGGALVGGWRPARGRAPRRWPVGAQRLERPHDPPGGRRPLGRGPDRGPGEPSAPGPSRWSSGFAWRARCSAAHWAGSRPTMPFARARS